MYLLCCVSLTTLVHGHGYRPFATSNNTGTWGFHSEKFRKSGESEAIVPGTSALLSDPPAIDYAAALAESLGADHLIDRGQNSSWSEVVYDITHKQGADIVVDNVGTTFPESFRAAARGGRILTVGNTGHPRVEIDNRYVFAKHLSLIGSTMGTHNDFRSVMDLVFKGRLKSILDQTFPLRDAGAAQTRLERGEQVGKITLEIS